MIPITAAHREQAEAHLDRAGLELRRASVTRNLDHDTREAINRAVDSVNLASALLAQQPVAPVLIPAITTCQ